MEASGTPTPQPEPPQPPPPPPPGSAPASDKPSGGIRALAVVLALVLGFGAAVMIAVGVEISDTPTLAEIESGEEPVPSDGEFYDGSESNRTVVTILLYVAGALGALAAILGLVFAITGNRGRLFVQVAVAAVIVAAIALII